MMNLGFVERKQVYITKLGYLYCRDCIDRGLERKMFLDELFAIHGIGYYRDSKCDLCERLTEQFPADQLPITSDHWVEPIAFKIF